MKVLQTKLFAEFNFVKWIDLFYFQAKNYFLKLMRLNYFYVKMSFQHHHYLADLHNHPKVTNIPHFFHFEVCLQMNFNSNQQG